MVFRYNFPRGTATQLRREMDRLLSSFAGNFADGSRPWVDRGQPSINLWETGDALVAEAELPGVQQDQIEISVVGNELTLKVERPELEKEGLTFHRRERANGSFVRVVRLPTEIDANRVEADLRNGVLTVTLPKAESARPRKISVKTS
jgi:HSP20 family protein